MEQPRQIWIPWSWYLLIYGDLLECSLQGGRLTLCRSWMGVPHISMALTFRTNQIPLPSLLSTPFGLSLNRYWVEKFAAFTLIGLTICLPGRVCLVQSAGPKY